MTTPEQVIAKIREALEAGPTPGEWCAGDKWIFVSPASGVPTHALENILRDRPADEIDANVSFIAAVNPQNIAVLIQSHEDYKADYLRRHKDSVDHLERALAAEAERDARVKPLEWHTYPGGGNRMAEGQNQQRNFVSRALLPWGSAFFTMEKDGAFTLEGSTEVFFDTEQAAKDAAQTQFDAWILAALAATATDPALSPFKAKEE